MRLNFCLTVLCMSILAASILSVETDSEDSDCEFELRVRRNTVYEVFLGEDLKINCTVRFCNDSGPTVSWYKFEKGFVPVNVSSGSHIKTGWEDVKHLEGISYLIFKNILMSNSGVYQCRSGLIVGHPINVSVIDCVELTDVTVQTNTMTFNSSSPTVQDARLPYVYRLAAIMVFVIILIIIWATSKYGCKGVCCAGRSRDKSDPSCQRSRRSLRNTHVYENDP
ncbi:B- and T-lymphocyte attenuator-like [Dicentrarchus labrax]|uniref:B- and T-lymphocyte attenuator-like n=1 Tax=Dicentrarchus labrax TaxID=13489 RepID=UPI0021F69126|nr:B- and T-lymphocyte attenuator-like [Dicentrarchus labrax]